MNRKLVGVGASSIILVIIAAVAAYTFMQPIAKPQFHPFNVREGQNNTVYFQLQNMGTATATQVIVKIRFYVNPSSRISDLNGQSLEFFNGSVTIPKIESKEVNEYSFNWASEETIPQIGGAGIYGEAFNRYDFYITCAEGIAETFTLPAT